MSDDIAINKESTRIINIYCHNGRVDKEDLTEMQKRLQDSTIIRFQKSAPNMKKAGVGEGEKRTSDVAEGNLVNFFQTKQLAGQNDGTLTKITQVPVSLSVYFILCASFQKLPV